jgi:hypothetical protein
MAAKAATNTAMSIKKAQAQREPAGRSSGGGIGAGFVETAAGVGTGESALRKSQFAAGGVVIEEFGVAAPLDGRFELATRFVLAEMFIEQILKKFGWEGATIFGFECLLHLTKERDVGKSSLAKDSLAFLNVGFGKGQAFGR